MTPSTLEWFAIKLCQEYVHAPEVARELGKRLASQLKSKYPRVQINREFKRSRSLLAPTLDWIKSPALRQAARDSTYLARKNRLEALYSLRQIESGEFPSKAWGMDTKRGPKVTFSISLEASALVHYLTNIQETDLLPEQLFPNSEQITDAYTLLVAYILAARPTTAGRIYSEKRAREIAGELFGLHPDSIRHFDTVQPIDDLSVAVCVAFALIRHCKLVAASRYIDVNELFDVIGRAGYLPVTN